MQEDAVRKLIKVTKPGNPVIIVYSNPNTIVSSLRSLFTSLRSSLPYRMLRRVKRLLKKPEKKRKQEEDVNLYFYLHPIEWWNRFNDIASVKILPFRSFSSDIQKIIIPNNKIGKIIFDTLFNLEEQFPDFFVKHFQYPMIILTKKQS